MSARRWTTLTVVLPEFVRNHWFERYSHNRTAARLCEALHERPNTIGERDGAAEPRR